MSDIKVGGYYMQRGGLVRIAAERNGRYETEYVQRRDDGAILCGGHSSSWPASDYTPITDPKLYAIAQAYEAMRLKHDAEVSARRHEADANRWSAAVQAIDAALRATGATHD